MSITPELLFEIWAPDSSPWAAWAKPVAFAHLDPIQVSRAPSSSPQAMDVAIPDLASQQPRPAIVVDRAGPASVWTGLALARHGWRPVPLFNACPTEKRQRVAVDVGATLDAIVAATAPLEDLALPIDAPPAFLLDSQRMSGFAGPGEYDNRWSVFPEDFPSANALRAGGIERVCLIHAEQQAPRTDLRHVLRRWADQGIAIEHWCPQMPRPEPLDVPVPSHFGSVLHRLLVMLRLRPNSAGGFGSTVPIPQESSGFG